MTACVEETQWRSRLSDRTLTLSRYELATCQLRHCRSQGWYVLASSLTVGKATSAHGLRARLVVLVAVRWPSMIIMVFYADKCLPWAKISLHAFKNAPLAATTRAYTKGSRLREYEQPAQGVSHSSQITVSGESVPSLGQNNAFARSSSNMFNCHHRSIVYIINSCKYYNPYKQAQNA